MKIGIIGMGRFGSYMADKLQGCEVVGYDVCGSTATLQEAAGQAVVVFAVPMRRLRESLYGGRPVSA